MLLVLLFIKHYIADFLLQTDAMVKGKGAEKGWVMPLLGHTFVHAAFTWCIVGFYIPFTDPSALNVGLWVGVTVGEIIAHFIIDRIKASPFILHERFKDPTQKPFWNALGADQLAHALTYLAIAYVVT